MRIKIILVAFYFISCSTNNSENKSNLNTNPTPIAFSVPDENNALHYNLNQALVKFGPPIEREAFNLDHLLISEFRIELHNIYTEEDFQNGLLIEELTWRKDSLNNITIWYEKVEKEYLPKQYAIWNKWMEF